MHNWRTAERGVCAGTAAPAACDPVPGENRDSFARSTAWRSRLALALMLGLIVGCPPRKPIGTTFDPLPLPEATGIVNRNIAAIPGTLRAVGSVDGVFRMPDGRSVSYGVDGVLFYLAPRFIRFDLKHFGDRKFLIGSNLDHFWFYSAADEDWYCGRHGVDAPEARDLPIRADQIVDALGLTPIPPPSSVNRYEYRVQRITELGQEVLFLTPRPTGPGVELQVAKEYWLDGLPPRLIRRVVFRDTLGRVEMDALLDDYRPLAGSPVMLPHSLSAEWPTHGAKMKFRIQRWECLPDVKPDGVQFQAPPACEGL